MHLLGGVSWLNGAGLKGAERSDTLHTVSTCIRSLDINEAVLPPLETPPCAGPAIAPAVDSDWSWTGAKAPIPGGGSRTLGELSHFTRLIYV